MFVLNKMDSCAPGGRRARRRRRSRRRRAAAVSALKGKGLESVLERLAAAMPEGPLYFPEGQSSDQPLEVLVGELIREQALRATREEVPHAIAVEVESIEERPGGNWSKIEARLVVEHESQKAILVGKGGSVIKHIGTAARREIEGVLGARVYLGLRVKVSTRWRRDERTSSVRSPDTHSGRPTTLNLCHPSLDLPLIFDQIPPSSLPPCSDIMPIVLGRRPSAVSPDRRIRFTVHVEELAKTIDHTLLRPDTTSKDVERLCKEAAGPFRRRLHLPALRAAGLRAAEGARRKVCSVIGFPFGADSVRGKVAAAETPRSTGRRRDRRGHEHAGHALRRVRLRTR